MGNILPDSEALEPIDPTLPLLQIHRIGGQIPVHDFPAVEMEVQALLPD